MRSWLKGLVQYLIPTIVVVVMFRRDANRWAPRELGIDILIAVGYSVAVKALVDAISAGAGRILGRRR